MANLTYDEVIKILKVGNRIFLAKSEHQDFGTKSFTKPIKNTGKTIKSFKLVDIDGRLMSSKTIHWKTGERLINQELKLFSSQKTLGGVLKKYNFGLI